MDDVARDAVATVLAILDVADEGRMLGIVDEEVAQQRGRVADVLARRVEECLQLGVEGGAAAP